MSGSEFERENIVTDALSADPASKPFEPAREHTWRPPAEGLYDPSLEKDSCGVGFIANIKGKKSHQIVSDAISILCNLEHRGAVGADPRAGDGAGILVQIPHAFFARKAKELGFTLPQPGYYAVGALFMPRERPGAKSSRASSPTRSRTKQLTLLGWRDVPTDNSSLGETVKPTEPAHMQVFIGRKARISRARTISNAGSTSCASRSRRRSISAATAASPAITRCRCRAAPSSTRACSSPTSSASIIPTCTSPISRARWRWCISASRPTPSRPGRWRIPTG